MINSFTRDGKDGNQCGGGAQTQIFLRGDSCESFFEKSLDLLSFHRAIDVFCVLFTMLFIISNC